MPNSSTSVRWALAIVVTVSCLASLFAAYRRFHVEESNRRVEIGLEWQEIVALSQSSLLPIPLVLKELQAEHVTSVVIAEDTITTMEQSGAVRPIRTALPPPANAPEKPIGIALVDTEADLARITRALEQRGMPAIQFNDAPPVGTTTVFEWSEALAPGRPAGAAPPKTVNIGTSADYAGLRTMGLGLPPDAVEAAKTAGLRIAGRISNYPGVTPDSAAKSLRWLGAQGASTVIFSGEEVLGYRGVERDVADILKGTPPAAVMPAVPGPPPSVPTYGAVEFGKQKGDEKLSADLNGEFVRVHSIQAAEMGQMEEEEAVDRFVRAGKERNIRFCYVRLLTFASGLGAHESALDKNKAFLAKIAAGLANGNVATGGGLGFGPARRFAETGVPRAVLAIAAIGAAAGLLWMLHALATLPKERALFLLFGFAVLFSAAAFAGETGRKLVAFVVGVVYPAVACLLTYPGRRRGEAAGEPVAAAGNASNGSARSEPDVAPSALKPSACLAKAVRTLGFASGVTALGIVQVIGLLASRSFMLHANQYLGIKAQHAIPVLLIALIAIAGGAIGGEQWSALIARCGARLREAMAEPARFGTLALGIVAIAALALVVARTGNDAGVGVSGTELQIRGYLDHILPVRPRTKEFLVGHPAFVLAIAWWLRGRRRLAIPAFVVGSLGQASLLNTFCHIHTPLVVSIWRGALGLIIGALIGAAIFLALEILFNLVRPTTDAGPDSLSIGEPARPVGSGPIERPGAVKSRSGT